MKKAYKKPEIEIISVATEAMIASSTTLGVEDTPADDDYDGLSKEYNFDIWED